MKGIDEKILGLIFALVVIGLVVYMGIVTVLGIQDASNPISNMAKNLLGVFGVSVSQGSAGGTGSSQQVSGQSGTGSGAGGGTPQGPSCQVSTSFQNVCSGSPVASTDKPDQTICASFSQQPPFAKLTSSINIIATVTNSNKPASSTKIVVTDGGREVASSSSGGLDAGGAKNVPISLGSYAQPGCHPITISVDPNNEIAESSETNNQIIFTFEVR